MLNNIIVTDVKEVFLVSSPKGRAETIHDRKNYGLSFCFDGQITYTHNGNKFISDKNHAILLPQNETYTIYGDKDGTFPVINFTCNDKICDTIISIPIPSAERYIKDFEKIQSLYLFEGNHAEIMSIFYHMLHRLSSQNSPNAVILPAIKYLEKKYSDPYLTNTELAKQCSISEVYFRRIFKEYNKISPRQFLIDIRINKAKQLLREGNLKICAIATSCGFSNQYHFCRIFKEKTGITPTKYMEQNRNYKI